MEIRVLNENPIFDYKHACLITKGKALKSCSYPADPFEYWVKHLSTEHSTTRAVKFVITDTQPKSVIAQIIRATKGHPQPEVQSSRPDWTGKERSNDPYESILFQVEYTAESFLLMARQRLCNKTEEKTRRAVRSWVLEMRKSINPYIRALGYMAEPQCLYRGGVCSELEPCGMFNTTKYDLIMQRVNKHE